jgi:hypothetical protein
LITGANAENYRKFKDMCADLVDLALILARLSDKKSDNKNYKNNSLG